MTTTKQNEASPFTVPSESLEAELAALEVELSDLNARRTDLYRRSLAASDSEKACVDMIANAMLAGPLDAKHEIKWPLNIAGVGWAESSTIFHRMEDRNWLSLTLHSDPSHAYLGLQLANVATSVEARLGEDKILHLSHAGHVSAIWCPALSRLVMPAEANVEILENNDGLNDLYGPDHSHPWHALAWDDLLEKLSEEEE